MDFVLITLAMVVAIVLALALVGRLYPGTGTDLLGWQATREREAAFQLERDDVQQMIAAQNEYRRKRGADELTADDVARMVRDDERVRARGRMDERSLVELDRRLRQRGEEAPARRAPKDGHG